MMTSTMPLASVTHVSLCPLPLNLKWGRFGPTSDFFGPGEHCDLHDTFDVSNGRVRLPSTRKTVVYPIWINLRLPSLTRSSPPLLTSTTGVSLCARHGNLRWEQFVPTSGYCRQACRPPVTHFAHLSSISPAYHASRTLNPKKPKP